MSFSNSYSLHFLSKLPKYLAAHNFQGDMHVYKSTCYMDHILSNSSLLNPMVEHTSVCQIMKVQSSWSDQLIIQFKKIPDQLIKLTSLFFQLLSIFTRWDNSALNMSYP